MEVVLLLDVLVVTALEELLAQDVLLALAEVVENCG